MTRLVFDGFDTLKDTLCLSNELIKNVNPNKTRMFNLAKTLLFLLLQIFLVKDKKMSFREAYKTSIQKLLIMLKKIEKFGRVNFE